MSENTRTSKLANTRKKVVRFFADIRNELKKVVWPTRKQLINSTVSVLLICLIIGAIIWVSDAILGQVIGWTLNR
jgi:preprotein translocase subunit SecE